MEITNGTIIRFSNDENRDWICIHYTQCENNNSIKYRKHIKNHTGFYVFGGLWFEGDILTNKPYGKCKGMLEAGSFAHIQIVGHISNKEHLFKYKTLGRI